VNVLADIFDDKLVEGNEYFTFVITGTSTKAIVPDSTWAPMLQLDIYDNDKAYIWLEPLADANENGTPGLFAIRNRQTNPTGPRVEISPTGVPLPVLTMLPRNAGLPIRPATLL
jgi:hypothetical protein